MPVSAIRPFYFRFLATVLLISTALCQLHAQNLSTSPYSRFGLGELNSTVLAPNMAMGGTYIGMTNDTTAPFFINTGNPAALANLRMTTLELGGQGQFSRFISQGASVNKNATNFTYGVLGFPLKRFGGACIGLMPFSSVGYNITDIRNETNIGDVKYTYNGTGGLNKAFFGIGIRPFRGTLQRFRRSGLADSLLRNGDIHRLRRMTFGRSLVDNLSIGTNIGYLFGNITQTADAIFPGSITFYNTRRQRILSVNDVYANYGLQTSFQIDSLNHHVFRHPLRVTLGYFVSLPTLISSNYGSLIYTYSLDGVGSETPKDTVLNSTGNRGTIRLPLEQGVGLSVSSLEHLTVGVDVAFTKWQQFRYLDAVNELKNSYRISVGMNWAPNKSAVGDGAYFKKIQYRLGATYSNGSLELQQTRLANYAVTAGLGLPVGQFFRYSVVNVSAQFGSMGSTNNSLIREKYVRLIIGFTFNSMWFQKTKYD